MTRIVVGLDGSRAARHAFEAALREAQWREASLDVVHVVVVPIVAGRDISRHDIDRLRLYGQNLVDRELSVIEEEHGGSLPVGVNTHVAVGHPCVEIMAVAEGGAGADPAALVVLGSRGLGGFRGLLLGSVTTYAVHHMTAPLLIVPATVDHGLALDMDSDAQRTGDGVLA
ncbi:MAG: universal stress protein [Acidimicrobiales bacterium]